MQVFEPYGSRFEFALERFRAGRAFSYHGVQLWLAPDGYLGVGTESSWSIENTTEQTALADLQRAKKVVDSLIEESSPFAALVRDCPRQYILNHDYGTGSVELCHLVNGVLVWVKGMPLR
jgi:hypothetical protein